MTTANPGAEIVPQSDSKPPLLSMRGIGKSFPGVVALSGVDLDLHAGEVLALLGENGAGKSTLIKTLGGLHAPDVGVIRIDGREIAIRNPSDARRAGIAVIYQEFNLVPALTAAENIFLGNEPTRFGLIQRGEERRRAKELFQRIGAPVDPEALVRDLSVAQQQTVEIAKALAAEARVVVMDEPSATLTPQEVGRLFAVVRELKAQGVGVVYISHRLDEIFEIADRAAVLRDGKSVGSRSLAGVSRDELIEMMVGRRLDREFPPRRVDLGAARLRVKNLAGGIVRGVSFEVRAGEIVGLTGLVGSGRTETARMIFGADPHRAGSVELDGRTLRLSGPRDAIAAGVALLTEDRKGQGLVLAQSLRENFGLPNLEGFSRFGFVDRTKESSEFARHIEALQIKLPDQEAPAKNLSGGNQQKVVLAKWLQRNCEVVVFDEPTRGVDVGAKYEIYLLMNELAAAGKAILMITSELPEALGMSDRILVMHEGRLVGEIADVRNATQEQILKMAVG